MTADDADAGDPTRMPLRQHLEELRGCLLRGTLVFVGLFVVGLLVDEPMVRFVLLPYDWAVESMVADGQPDPGPLIFIRPAEAILFSMKLAGSLALIVGAPVYLWELWRFVAAGLHAHERRAVRRAFPPAVLLFVVGLAFGFFVALRFALPMLLTWLPPDVARSSITVSEYFATTVNLTVVMGGVFELPVLMWLVVRAGLVRHETLARSRKVAIVVILVFAAVVTPPDVVTQVLVALPMTALYEVGLVLARRAERARLRAVL